MIAVNWLYFASRIPGGRLFNIASTYNHTSRLSSAKFINFGIVFAASPPIFSRPSVRRQRVVAALPSGTRTHAFLAVDSTLVSLYSGRQVTELSPAALLHLLLLIDSLRPDSAGPANGRSAYHRLGYFGIPSRIGGVYVYVPLWHSRRSIENMGGGGGRVSCILNRFFPVHAIG